MNWADFKRIHETKLLLTVRQNVPSLKNADMYIDWGSMKLIVNGEVYHDNMFDIATLKKINAIMWPIQDKKAGGNYSPA